MFVCVCCICVSVCFLLAAVWDEWVHAHWNSCNRYKLRIVRILIIIVTKLYLFFTHLSVCMCLLCTCMCVFSARRDQWEFVQSLQATYCKYF